MRFRLGFGPLVLVLVVLLVAAAWSLTVDAVDAVTAVGATAQDTAPATSGNPDDPAQLVSQAAQALSAGDLDTAEALFRRAAEAAPELSGPALGLSAVAEGRGDVLGSLVLARSAPDGPGKDLAIGRLLARLGRRDEALAALARARTAAPAQPTAYGLAGLLLAEAGRYPEAIEVLTEAVALPSAPVGLREELARLHLANDEPAKAADVAGAALERLPDRAELHALLGRALAGDPAHTEEAVKSFEQALELGVSSPSGVHEAFADLLNDLERTGEAAEHLRSAAELEPGAAQVQYKLGTALRQLGRPEEAQAALERFRELSTRADEADRAEKLLGTKLNEAQAMVNENRLQEALLVLDSLLAGAPEEPRVLALKGKVLFSLGQPEPALEAIQQARSLSPSAVENHLLAGMFLMHLTRPAEAQAALRGALALEPRLPEAHALLGTLAANGKQLEEALAHFRSAIDLGGESAALRLRLAQILHEMGRLDESREQLEIYKELVESAG